MHDPSSQKDRIPQPKPEGRVGGEGHGWHQSGGVDWKSEVKLSVRANRIDTTSSYQRLL